MFKGAQDPSYIKKPDEKTLAKWNEISGGLLRIVTYAPEEADPSFETWCKENGVVLSAGHSNALYEELNASGATHVTHLYNAQRGLNHREPGVTGYGMLAEGVHAELICDGKHIVPDMVKLACKVRGYDGIELITDSMRAKGMPEGKSELGGQVVIVKDGMAAAVLEKNQSDENTGEVTSMPVLVTIDLKSGTATELVEPLNQYRAQISLHSVNDNTVYYSYSYWDEKKEVVDKCGDPATTVEEMKELMKTNAHTFAGFLSTDGNQGKENELLSLIHISEPTRH